MSSRVVRAMTAMGKEEAVVHYLPNKRFIACVKTNDIVHSHFLREEKIYETYEIRSFCRKPPDIITLPAIVCPHI